MQGFMFTEEEMRTSPANDPRSSCLKCGLAEKCRNPYMKTYGQGRKKILLIGEWPSSAEDRAGIPMVDSPGNLIMRTLGKQGISMENDCWRTKAILCAPKSEKGPTNGQIQHCRKYLYQTIEALKPEKIFTFGPVALQGLLGHKMNITGIAKYVGEAIPDAELNATIYPMYGPGYIQLYNDNRGAYLWFEKHIEKALAHPGYSPNDYKNQFETLQDDDKVIDVLKKMMAGTAPVTFDYETTGIKPYNEGHEIAYASVCNGGTSYGFEVTPGVVDTFRQFLRHPVRKIAHNIKFEHKWSNKILGVEVNNWYWDTMIAAHILDNRSGVTGLKHQTFVKFGVHGYDNAIHDYLRARQAVADQYGTNAINRIREAPRSMAMEYCALDSKFTWHLYELQKPLIGQYKTAFDFFMKSLPSMGELEENGICADRGFYESNKAILEKRLVSVRQVVMENEYVHKDFNPDSPMQVAKILYDKMGYECKKETKNGGRSTDNEALELTGAPWAEALIEHRKLSKLINTYMSGFLREISDDGRLHCNFNLNTVSTFRSSSSAPNFQNIPKRDKDAMNMTRGGLRAAPGHFLAELDFKGVEVSISACYHKDPNMIRYIEDPTTDMHRDMARRLFLKDDITKLERFAAKNGMTFAQFYGDYYGNCGPAIWEIINAETKAGLKAKGIRNVAQFTSHVQTVEEWMWGEMFPHYDRWKDQNWENYQQHGYIEYFTGFRTQGIMDKNFINNCAIQGTAFHVLLWTLNYVVNKLHRLESFPMGQIHDSMILSIAPGEEEVIMEIVKNALNEIRRVWKWIIVPLTIEYERTGVDEPWTKLEERPGITSDLKVA